MARIIPKHGSEETPKSHTQIEPKRGESLLDRRAREEFEGMYSRVSGLLESKTGMKIPDKERLVVKFEEDLASGGHRAFGTYSKDHEMQVDMNKLRDLAVVRHIAADTTKSEEVRRDATIEARRTTRQIEEMIAHELVHAIRRATMFDKQLGRNIVSPPAEEALATFVSSIVVGHNSEEVERGLYSSMAHARPIIDGAAREKDLTYKHEPGYSNMDNMGMQDYRNSARSAPGYVIGYMAALTVVHGNDEPKTNLAKEVMGEQDPVKLLSRLIDLATIQNPSNHALVQAREMMQGYVKNFREFERFMDTMGSIH